MEVKKEITVKLTVEELSDIVKQHLKTKENLDIDSVRFDIEETSDGYGDYYSELEGATCYGNLK